RRTVDDAPRAPSVLSTGARGAAPLQRLHHQRELWRFLPQPARFQLAHDPPPLPAAPQRRRPDGRSRNIPLGNNFPDGPMSERDKGPMSPGTHAEVERTGEPDKAAVARLRARLQSYMAKKGLRSTSQRRLIVDTFFGGASHMTIEDLLNEVRSRDKGI